MTEHPAHISQIIALIRPAVALMAHLQIEDRISLLCSLLTQKLCKLPPSERQAELAIIIDQLPNILRSTEEGMRDALTDNARNGQ